MRFLGTVMALVLLAGISGCDLKSSESSGSGSAYPPLVADDPPSKVSYTRSGRDLQDAVASSPVTRGAEGLAQSQRATFDGDKRSLGGLGNNNNDGVPASVGPWGSSKQKVELSPAKKNTLKTGEVPPPDSLPDVDLPAGQSVAGTRGGGPTLLAFDAFQHKMYDTFSPLLSRLGWGAAPRKGKGTKQNPYRVTVHNTAGHQTMDEASTIKAVQGVQHYHMAGRAQEGKDIWDDIGYHFLIDGEGRIIEGRPPEIMGAHAKNYNEGNIGVALMGEFNKDKPTDAQIKSLERLVSFLAIKYRRDPSYKGFLQPHQHFNSTDCPGKNVMAILDRIRSDVDNQTNDLVAKLQPGSSFTPLYTVASR